jgi:predicted RNA polymerase sigma factor
MGVCGRKPSLSFVGAKYGIRVLRKFFVCSAYARPHGKAVEMALRLICEAGTRRSNHAHLMVSPSESSRLMARRMSRSGGLEVVGYRTLARGIRGAAQLLVFLR